MTRLTVSLDDDTAQELQELQVQEWREVIDRAIESVPPEESSLLVLLSKVLDDLGAQPSASAVMREALDLFLGLLRETRDSVALYEGYLELAEDEEHNELVSAIAERTREAHRDREGT